MMKTILDERSELQKHLFIRGFLITNSQEVFNLNHFPFYSNWDINQIHSYQFLTHKSQNLYYLQKESKIFFLVGHAYNPFTMESEEKKILEKISKNYFEGEDAYFESINELTGLFLLGYVEKDEIHFLLDPSGFQTGYYGEIIDDFFITSHIQLLGDLYDLKMDALVEELVNYRWYGRVDGPHLPADLSKYSDFKRIVPNFHYHYKKKKLGFERFYPRDKIKTCDTHAEYKAIVREAARILQNNMNLIAEKWANPYISLTGGIDSTTTFAAANGYYDKYETFSYVSKKSEAPDAEAAEKIANRFNVNHTTYIIPENTRDLNDYEAISRIIDHNNGYIQYVKDYEKRKRVFLMIHCPADVDVKSWGSETIRASYYKEYNRTTMPELSGKLFRNLYKIFLTNRSLARKIDQVFEEYIEKYGYKEVEKFIPISDLYVWEVVWGSWGGPNLSEMKICFEHTVPYNNRKLLDLLFKVPFELKLSDQHHLDMKHFLNEELHDMNVIVNSRGSILKVKGLSMIFSANMILPF